VTWHRFQTRDLARVETGVPGHAGEERRRVAALQNVSDET
jgi:hypothetical protein